MDYSEMLNRFDVLYNNITSSQAPGVDEYEKCVFWNKAQLEVLKNHLNPRGNKYGEGIDGSSKRQVEFSELIDTADMSATGHREFAPNAIRFVFQTGMSIDKILVILNEYASCDGAKTLVGVPINNVEYDTLMSRPYKMPPKSQCWRLIVDGHFEVIGKPSPTGYHIRYVRMPRELDPDGNTVLDVPEVLHDEVLQRAVELAKAAYVGDANQQQILQALGERSE